MIIATCRNNHSYDTHKYFNCPFCEEEIVSNPTGNALMARIKELEEELAEALAKLNNVNLIMKYLGLIMVVLNLFILMNGG